MLKIPSLLLKQLYTFNSLKNSNEGVCFSLKNRLNDAKLIAINSVKVDGNAVPTSSIAISFGDDVWLSPAEVQAKSPIDFPLRAIVDIRLSIDALPTGKHKLEINFESKPFGKLTHSLQHFI